MFLVSDDYSATSQVLTFGTSSTSGATLNAMIPIVDDDRVEMAETISVQGSESSDSAIFQLPQTIVNILDNDSTLIPVIHKW